MSKIISLKCKNCNSNLECAGRGKYVCSWCGTEYLIDDTPVTDDNSAGQNADFVIVAATLQEYSGASTRIVIPEGVTAIGDGVFCGMSMIESVYLPSGLTEIGKQAFDGCSRLRDVVFPESVRRVGDFAFRGCALTEVVFESALERLGNGAFMDCESVTRVSIPHPLPINCKNTFKRCVNLNEVEISDASFAPAFRASMDVNKHGDTRPTYADLFYGTPYLAKLIELFGKKEYWFFTKYGTNCIYCGGELTFTGKCKCCGVQYYF